MKVAFDPAAINEGINQSKVDRNDSAAPTSARVESNQTMKAFMRVCKTAQRSTTYSYGQPSNPSNPEVIMTKGKNNA